jgi:hypothetical protein
MSESFSLDKFVSDRKDLVDRLYAEAKIEVKSFEDLLNLPVNEEYAKNQLKRQNALQNLNSNDISKEDE